MLVDDSDHGLEPRVLLCLEHEIRDARAASDGTPRTLSRQMIYLDFGREGFRGHIRYAPYLDFRPLAEHEPGAQEVLAQPECAWINQEIESKAEAYANKHMVPRHLEEVRQATEARIDRTEAAVKRRLTREISYWDHRSEHLRVREKAGRPDARSNSREASKWADQLEARLSQRIGDFKRERQISAAPPVSVGGMLVVPKGLLDKIAGVKQQASPATDTKPSPRAPGPSSWT